MGLFMSQFFLRLIIVLGTGAILASASFPAFDGGAARAKQPSREARVTKILRVCADANSLPFSNKKEEGFENKIARLIAEELKQPIRYNWWPQTIGFVRNTLRLRRCDLIVGIGTGNELVQNTNPYYRSIYTMVYRQDSGLKATSLSDPALKSLRFGVIAGTPPATLLVMHGLIDGVQSYNRNVDTRFFSPGHQAISDVAEGKTDVALIWGPISGYFAKRQRVALVVVPLLNEQTDVRLDFWVSMAVRANENDWKRRLNRILQRLQPKIDRILKDYGVPLLDRQRRLISD